MKVGDRVTLIYAPAGWDGVGGHIIPDDQAEEWEADGMVLVEWSNGETCYERPDSLTTY